MSEQAPQNQNILNEEELRARDDAIFDTVAEFRNELDNPAEQQVKVPEYAGIGDQDAENKVDVDAIFSNRKAETTQVGTGRRRKAYDEKLDKQRLSEEMEDKRDLLEKGVQIKPIEGFGRHRAGQDAFEVTLAAKHDGSTSGKKRESLEEAAERAAAESAEDPDALARAEAAARGYEELPYGTALRRPFAGSSAGEAAAPDEDTSGDGAFDHLYYDPSQQGGYGTNGGTFAPDVDTAAPVPTPVVAPRAATDPVVAAQRAFPAAGGVPRPPRVPSLSELGSGLHTPAASRAPEVEPAAPDDDDDDEHAIGANGLLIGDDGRMGGNTSTEPGEPLYGSTDGTFAPDTNVPPANTGEAVRGELLTDEENALLTGEARLRDRVIGKLATAKMFAKELGGVAKTFANYSADLLYRKPVSELTDADRRGRPYAQAAAIGAGAMAVAVAVLGANKIASAEFDSSSAAKGTVAEASQTPDSGKSYGPQIPKSSETPLPSPAASSESAKPTPRASVSTPKASPTTSAPVAGPSIIPSFPTFENKPPVPEPESTAPSTNTSTTEQTKRFAHEDLTFTTKDGRLVRATATLKPGGTIFEAAHDAGLTDTQIMNALEKSGISDQEARSIQPGQQIEVAQDGDSYEVNLR